MLTNVARSDLETAVLLALLNARPDRMSWAEIASEASLRNSARALWNEHFHGTDFEEPDPDSLIKSALDQLTAWAHADFTLLSVLDEFYPIALREIHQLPPILFVKGRLDPHRTGVSVVGSRNASPEGLAFAGDVARGLVQRDVAVLSGLALGIDAAAHEATLDASGVPIGVIGTGINRVYPAANKHLHARVAAAGALVSQFWPDAPPNRHTFPMRNITMSGLGRVSVVVQASEVSGARIQARVAVEHGRPVILSDLVVRSTEWGKALIVDDILDSSPASQQWGPSLTDLTGR